MKAEDWLYEAHSLGIRDEVFNDIYEKAFNQVKNR